MIQRSENQPMAIVKIYYALLSEVSSIATDSDQKATVVLTGTNVWKEFYGVFDSIELTEPEENTPAGALYNQQLKLVYPGDDATIRKNIFALKERELIIKAEYNNATSKIIGDIGKPVFISAGYQSKGFDTYREIVFGTQSNEPAKFSN